MTASWKKKMRKFFINIYRTLFAVRRREQTTIKICIRITMYSNFIQRNTGSIRWSNKVKPPTSMLGVFFKQNTYIRHDTLQLNLTEYFIAGISTKTAQRGKSSRDEREIKSVFVCRNPFPRPE